MESSLLVRLNQHIADKPLLSHPFYQAWQAGELSIDDLRAYAIQYYFFEMNFPRFLSAVHSRCADLGVRQNILDNLWDEEHGETNHRAMWLNFCDGLGLNQNIVEHSRIHPKTQSLLDTYTTVCSQGIFQEGLAAIYAYEQQVPQVSLEKIRGLEEHYGITDESSLAFFQIHSVLDVDHARIEGECIESQTRREDESVVEASLQAALDAWWGFLDGVEEQRKILRAIY
jgi:pyrroloquinoline-quinone synthase